MVVAVACVMLLRSADAFWWFNRPRIAPAEQVYARTNETVAVTDRLRVATYNLEHLNDGINDGPTNTLELARAHAQAAAAILERINPDVVFFQEVENEDALRLINNTLRRPYPLGFITRYQDKTGRPDPLNIAVLSRIPLAQVRTIAFDTLSRSSRPPRGVLAATVDLGPDRKLLLYGVHLKSNFGNKERNQAQRVKTMEIVRADVQQVLARNPQSQWEVAVAGDMNVDPDNEEFREDPSLTPFRDWIDLWRGRPIGERATCPTRYGDPSLVFPPASFDRVLVSPELVEEPWVALPLTALPMGVNTNLVAVLPGQDGHVSDHYPVYLDLRREP
ncbi:MAG: hypothetical protein A2X46_08215 [Lentisphaerae bacterium GWF2_57_35]|nr:MAG: hypothetical protein A2X46_08215 [Lentisphaerae bacterium GWF2_57_35]